MDGGLPRWWPSTPRREAVRRRCSGWPTAHRPGGGMCAPRPTAGSMRQLFHLEGQERDVIAQPRRPRGTVERPTPQDRRLRLARLRRTGRRARQPDPARRADHRRAARRPGCAGAADPRRARVEGARLRDGAGAAQRGPPPTPPQRRAHRPSDTLAAHQNVDERDQPAVGAPLTSADGALRPWSPSTSPATARRRSRRSARSSTRCRQSVTERLGAGRGVRRHQRKRRPQRRAGQRLQPRRVPRHPDHASAILLIAFGALSPRWCRSCSR